MIFSDGHEMRAAPHQLTTQTVVQTNSNNRRKHKVGRRITFAITHVPTGGFWLLFKNHLICSVAFHVGFDPSQDPSPDSPLRLLGRLTTK